MYVCDLLYSLLEVLLGAFTRSVPESFTHYINYHPAWHFYASHSTLPPFPYSRTLTHLPSMFMNSVHLLSSLFPSSLLQPFFSVLLSFSSRLFPYSSFKLSSSLSPFRPPVLSLIHLPTPFIFLLS